MKKVGVLKNLAKFTGKPLCWSLLKESFPENFAKCLRTLF